MTTEEVLKGELKRAIDLLAELDKKPESVYELGRREGKVFELVRVICLLADAEGGDYQGYKIKCGLTPEVEKRLGL